MQKPLIITKELLSYLESEHYTVLLLKFGENVYIPLKENIEDVIGSMSCEPFREDQLLTIPYAIAIFDELDFSNKIMLNIFENDQ
ncbi:hypothetical protein [Sphingobacterium faecium]|uniref:hypothetical protein n=1 Tax=Sphingobacterium faecium TaxID=34087 RepID=UPI003208D5E3